MAVTLLSCALLLQGCEHKDLCYDHSHMTEIEIRFEWPRSSKAESATMVVHFFTPDGRHFRRYEFPSLDGGRVKVEAGSYKLLFHNGEMENVNEAGNNYDEYGLITSSVSLLAPMGRTSEAPRPDHAASEPVRSVPQSVWAGRMENFEVKKGVGGQVVTLKPRMATALYTIEIRNVENMTNDVDISGAITGMAEGYNVSSEAPAGVDVTFPLVLERPDGHTLLARFASFGHCANEAKRHTFSVYTSNKVYHHFDITQQLHGAEDPCNVSIVIEGLKLPADGITPSVNDWGNVVDKEIDMT